MSEQPVQPGEPAVDVKGIKLTDDGGVVKEILVEGDGDTPPKNVTVSVHYVGTLLDGTKFDSSRNRDEFFKFKLGEGKVIKGWDIGVASMKKGEKCNLTCTSEYAYGDGGSPPKIPGGATLKFEVELFEWEEEKLTTDGYITKVRQIAEGDGWNTPNDGASCEVKVSGTIASSGHVWYPEQTKTFIVGEDETMPYGFNTIMKRMKKGEHTVFRIKPDTEFHFDTSYQTLPDGVSTTDELLLDVEMVGFTKAKEHWEMDTAEKLEHGAKIKAKGNELFKLKRIADAKKKYELVVSTLDNLSEATEEQQKAANETLAAAWSNLAMIQFNEKNYADSISNATKVLKVDPEHKKALFRRSKAHFATGESELAIADIKKALQVDKENKLFVAHYRMVKQKVTAERKKAKALYSKMFASAPKKQKTETGAAVTEEAEPVKGETADAEPVKEDAEGGEGTVEMNTAADD